MKSDLCSPASGVEKARLNVLKGTGSASLEEIKDGVRITAPEGHFIAADIKAVRVAEDGSKVVDVKLDSAPMAIWEEIQSARERKDLAMNSTFFVALPTILYCLFSGGIDLACYMEWRDTDEGKEFRAHAETETLLAKVSESSKHSAEPKL